MKIINIVVLICLWSCGFSDEEKGQGVNGVEQLKSNDLDGDLILNDREIELGLNKEIADVANVELRFNQNYKMELSFVNENKSEQLILEEIILNDDADFQYTYGEGLLSQKAFKESARVARFQGHSYGEVSDKETDLFVYPLMNDQYRYKNQIVVNEKLREEGTKLSNITLTIKANLFLKHHSVIDEIRNPVFGVYYYDYKNRKHSLLKEVSLDLVLTQNSLETVDIEIGEVPREFLLNNYFKKGELVLISLIDYEIPSLGTTYKNQLASIRAKTTTVSVFTPNGLEVSYVASMNNKSFVELMDGIYHDEFEVSDNEVTKLLEFENNLDGYEYLSEVRNEYKKGKWFIYTNKLRSHFLKHSYSPEDVLTISYITGNKLATQVQSQDRAYRYIVSNQSGLFKIGDMNRNSIVEFVLEGGEVWGDDVVKMRETIRPGGCRGNCRVADYACVIPLRHYTDKSFRVPFNFKIHGSLLRITVGKNKYYLNELISEGIISYEEVDGFLRFKVINTEYFFDDEFETKEIHLDGSTFRHMGFNGFKLESMSGKTSSYDCPNILVRFAMANNIPVSVESLNFDKWQSSYNWSRVKRGENREEVVDFDLTITSSVTNFYN